MSETPASRIRFEWIRCNACGADAFRRQLAIGRWEIGSCQRCSLIYVNPMPFFSAENFSDVTEDFYYTQWQRQLTAEKLRMSREEFCQQVARMCGLGRPPHSPAHFLDIGCGPGLAVRAACDEGWTATGLDIDAGLARLGREQLGVDLRSDDLLSSTLPSQTFDFVRLKFVLEHLPNPRAALSEIRRILRPGGLLLVIVPNEAGFFNRLRKRLGRDRDRLGTLIPPHHLHAYTPATLRRLLDAAGLAPRAIHSVAPHDPVYGTLDQRENRSLPRRFRQILWNAASLAGLGSVLVAWAGDAASNRVIEPTCLRAASSMPANDLKQPSTA